MREHDPKLAVAKGYDRIAGQYLEWYSEMPHESVVPHLDRATEGLQEGARVLDLGCAAGVPYARYLNGRFDVVGVDISRGQLALARRLVPTASFVLADMTSLAFQPGSFDAIIALYSIIHVPREEHEPLICRLLDWLRPGGRLLAVVGSRAWEGREQDWMVAGAEMYWSHFGEETYLPMFERTGFRMVSSDVVEDPLCDGAAHLFVLAERAE